MLNIEQLTTFCKKKGFVYPNSEIYGAMAGFFDYGPLGVELKNNIKQQWWKYNVQERQDVVGIDGTIITNPKVWKASGHIDCFEDVFVECTKCKERTRADHLVEDVLKISAEGLKSEDIQKLIQEKEIKCSKCQSELAKPSAFNLMFKTSVGPKEETESTAYLRPETAQVIFADFRLIQENARLKLPFGIAQIGKAFRNEISPRNFLYRAREFELMEIEYFVHPKKSNECPFINDVWNHKLQILSEAMQESKEQEKLMTIDEALNKKIIKTQWLAYWMAVAHKWFVNLGVNPNNFRMRQHVKDELAHYSSDCWDLEYKFPFGWKELQGFADRSDFDLQQHIKHSKKDLSIFDEESKEKIVPYVAAEPSLGVGRAFLVFLLDAYEDNKERENIVLKLHPQIAPIKAAIFPLVNKLNDQAKKIYNELKSEFNCTFDKSGSVGRRYARADEIGIPYSITFDFDSVKKDDVTIRDRDSTDQIRVKIKDLKEVLTKLLKKEIRFEKAGRKVETRKKED